MFFFTHSSLLQHNNALLDSSYRLHLLFQYHLRPLITTMSSRTVIDETNKEDLWTVRYKPLRPLSVSCRQSIQFPHETLSFFFFYYLRILMEFIKAVSEADCRWRTEYGGMKRRGKPKLTILFALRALLRYSTELTYLILSPKQATSPSAHHRRQHAETTTKEPLMNHAEHAL